MRKYLGILFAFIGLLGLSGCATVSTKWMAPDAGPMPKSLAVYIDPILVANPGDLRDDLPIDSSGVAAWMRNHLAAELNAGCGVDSIYWLDRLSLKTDTVKMGNQYVFFKRPVDTLPYQRVLVLSYGSTDRVKEISSSTYNGMQMGSLYLEMYTHYMLLDGRTNRDLAHGRVWSKSKFILHMDETDWDKVAKGVSKQIATNLPKR